MEINSGHSNVQIAIAVQPQNQSGFAQGSDKGNTFDVAAQATPVPSVNTSGQGVGYFINEWA
jgi:hypothetical protein